MLLLDRFSFEDDRRRQDSSLGRDSFKNRDLRPRTGLFDKNRLLLFMAEEKTIHSYPFHHSNFIDVLIMFLLDQLYARHHQ
jgi:hypothetical protein